MISEEMKAIREKGQWSAHLPGETVRRMAETKVRVAIAKTLPVQTLDEFIEAREGQGSGATFHLS